MPLRLIDLPALDEGSDHIFDRLPRKIPAAKMADWKREKFAEIANACEKNHGAAYRRYITALIAMGSKLAPYVQRRIDDFIRRVANGRDTELSRDIAKRFALLYVGGTLARRAGLVVWENKELLGAIQKCYARACAMLPDDDRLLRDGIEILAGRLTSLPTHSSSLKRLFNAGFDDVDGVRGNSSTGPYLIKRHTFDTLFVSRHQLELVEAWLLDNGALTKGLPKRGSADFFSPKEQHMWPDGRRRRSLEIKWPISKMQF